ncbi:MAG: hypothetical protein FJY75_00735 [Candidatus Eisenbacteria bacterium]|uniref:Uncharacterized protein n=1 Tax=Eiseniibacteriota bacterium TaxID=2212470 RepID=A0A937X8B2_UNCEI|nr:hypothetical protein [Candidatus Eisenbacteria bacterium]
MTTRTRLLARLFLASLLLAPGVGASEHWLHISVDAERSDERVRVNLPIELVESMILMVDGDDFRAGRLVLDRHGGRHDLDVFALLAALREARDGEYIAIQDGDDFVRVAKEEGRLTIRVEEPEEQVLVRVPLAVLDALVSSGEGRELDVAAAIRALAADDGSVITVDGDDERVRIWVDRHSRCE